MPTPSPEALTTRARRVKLVLLDVDGVLTDGLVQIEGSGRESKSFSIRDGAAIVWAQRTGLEIGLLSGRPSEATTRRASELGITTVLQHGPDKREPFQRLLAERSLTADDVAYMGDDLLDLPVLTRVGLSAAPADATPEVLSRVHWISRYPGGQGAVRELLEVILRAQQSWDAVVSRFLD
ncbi:MAG TPA: HAD hydrolase family protein [Vicinamibacterales bacterium]|nr:HAD hydrolase family protein [Vicinamibacterales bacterium]